MEQSLIKPSNSAAKSKKQKGKTIGLKDDEDETISLSALKAPVELTPDELIEEEWGPVKKKKKDKKGKAKIDAGDEDDKRKGLLQSYLSHYFLLTYWQKKTCPPNHKSHWKEKMKILTRLTSQASQYFPRKRKRSSKKNAKRFVAILYHVIYQFDHLFQNQ